MSGWLLSLFSHKELRERGIGVIFYSAWQGSHASCGVILSMFYKGARNYLAGSRRLHGRKDRAHMLCTEKAFDECLLDA